MTKFTLTAALALTVASVCAAASDPANAQTPAWAAIAANPVPSYQPFRGYNGAQTYIGQDYSNLGGGSGRTLTGAANDDGATPLHGAVDDLAEHLSSDCD